MVDSAVPKFYPRVQPGPDHAQTRTVNDAGAKARDSRTGKLSALPFWEGYRTFRDTRSPTGWTDIHRIPIDAVDTHGHTLRRNNLTGKLAYVYGTTPAGSGSFIDTLTGVLPFTGDVFGGLLNVAGLEDVNKLRVQTGVAATGAIFAAGGLGATDLDALTGGGGFSSLLGSTVPAAGIVPVGPAPASSRPQGSGDGGSWLAPFVLVVGAVVLVLVLGKRR